MADRFLIAPYDEKSGLQTDVKPFLIPDNAFSELQNAYVFRGRVRKRFGSRYMGGSQLLSRFRVNIGTSDGAGNFVGAVPLTGGVPIVTPAVGQLFSAGTQVFTVNVLGAPANMLISGAATVATFNNITGAVALNGVDINTIVYYYPALPVMGLLSAESDAINDEKIIGFDTKFAYQYVNGWERLNIEAVANASVWNGTDSQFHWSTNWSGADPSDHVFFVTNTNQTEPNYMRYLIMSTLQWNNFRPRLDPAGTTFLNSARILVVFKNRLVALNTWEGAAAPGLHYTNRARYSQIGSPIDITAFESSVAGKGNAIDAATTEAIVTAEFVKDRLIVYFERSTWELAYTGNQVYPFTWQQINTELGAESTHSIVPFDKVAIGVGNVGIHACNGSNTERIDSKIPDTVFQIHNANDGPNRVYGIRDYYAEMIYWTMPSDIANLPTPYPSRVLMYNYKNNTWAFLDDSITCFGYYQAQTQLETGITWDSDEVTWDSDVTWGGPSALALYRYVVAGNQEGYTFLCDPNIPTNIGALQITDLAVAVNVVTVTAQNNNLLVGDYVYFSGITGTGNLTLINDKIFQITTPPTQHAFTFTYTDTLGSVLAGVYSGAGVVARVSKISIKTKEFNFYASQLRNAYISKIDFMVNKTSAGQIQVNFYDSSNTQNITADSIANNVILGTATLDTYGYTASAAPIPFEATASRIWHPVYFQAEGNVVQFHLTQNNVQMLSTAIRLCDFQLHAMAINAQPTTQRIW